MGKDARRCGNYGKEVTIRFINFGPLGPGQIRLWLCGDCAGLTGVDTHLYAVAQKIEEAYRDGSLGDYKLSERLENLKGKRCQ